MAIVELTIKFNYEIKPGEGGYENLNLEEAMALDLEMLNDLSADPGELIQCGKNIRYSIRAVDEDSEFDI